MITNSPASRYEGALTGSFCVTGPGGGRRRPRRPLLLLLLALILPGLPAGHAGTAGETRRNPERNLHGERRIVLEPITSTELFGGPTEWSRSETGRSLLGPVVAKVVRRELPDVWQLRMLGEARPEDLAVSYELRSANGHLGYLSHHQQPEVEIEVKIRPLPPLVVAADTSGFLVQGGVELEIEVASVRMAGAYGGTLEVTLNQF